MSELVWDDATLIMEVLMDVRDGVEQLLELFEDDEEENQENG